MIENLRWVAIVALLATTGLGCHRAPEPERPELASWTDGALETRILAFVRDVSDPASSSYVLPAERIAVLDLDGTLIIERPLHLEVLVAMEILQNAASANPALVDVEPYRSVLAGDLDYVESHGAEIVTAAAEGGTVETYRRVVRSILRRQHPSLARPYSALFYAPMVELVRLLQEHGFDVFVVSQSQQEFIRAFAAPCLGIEPANVIGSMYAYDLEAGGFVRSGTVWEPYNRGEGKVLRIRERTGGLPIFAFGNGRGDRLVLEAAAAAETSLVLLLDHDDGAREFEYSSDEMVALARERGWEVVSMKREFKDMFQSNCLLAE